MTVMTEGHLAKLLNFSVGRAAPLSPVTLRCLYSSPTKYGGDTGDLVTALKALRVALSVLM